MRPTSHHQLHGRSSRVLLILSLMVSLLATAYDWPTYLHDVGRTANSPDSTLSTANAGSLMNLWSFTTGGVIASSPAVVNGTVYVGSWDGYEYALDAATGTMKWRTYLGQTHVSGCTPPTAGITSGAAVDNGVVYVGGGDSYWYALDAATGNILWKVFTGDNSATGGHYNWASPVIYNGSAYIGIASFGDCPLVQGQVLRVDLASHQVVATANLVPDGTVGGGVWTSPTLDTATNTLFVSTGTSTLSSQIYAQAMVALDGTTLAVKSYWTLPQSDAVSDSDWGNTPILFTNGSGNALVAATNKNGYIYAFNPTNLGNGPVWRTPIANGGSVPQNGDGSASSGAFGNGTLFMAGGNTTINGTSYTGSVQALNPATGSVVWQHGAPGTVLPAIAYANGLVIDGAGPTLEVLDANTGNRLYSYTTSGTLYAAPSVADGRIFFGGTNGVIYALGLPSSAPLGPGVTNTLASSFNNIGITDDSNGGAGSLDDVGYTYSAQALQSAGLTAGQPFTYNGITFAWPNGVSGGHDNVSAQGQTVSFPLSPSGTTLAFLGAATHGPTVGTATITYTDGSTQTFQLGLTDWTLNGGGAQPSYGNGVAASMSYRNPHQAITTDLFYTDVSLQSGRAVASVTLPSSVNQGILHIFAVAVGTPSAAGTSTSTATAGTATASGTPTATATGGGAGFTSGFETGQPQPAWANSVDTGPGGGGSANVGGICCGVSGPEAGVRNETTHSGVSALMYSGMDNSATSSYAYLKVFDLSSQPLAVGPGATLSYWVFPQGATSPVPVSGANSSCVAVDLVFADGTSLRTAGAVDQAGNPLTPAGQCGHLALDAWNHVTSAIGAVAAGKSVVRIDVGYDQPANTGGFRGYFDDLSISAPAGATGTPSPTTSGTATATSTATATATTGTSSTPTTTATGTTTPVALTATPTPTSTSTASAPSTPSSTPTSTPTKGHKPH